MGHWMDGKQSQRHTHRRARCVARAARVRALCVCVRRPRGRAAAGVTKKRRKSLVESCFVSHIRLSKTTLFPRAARRDAPRHTRTRAQDAYTTMSAVLNYFRKAPDPKDLVRKWQSELRSEQRGLERQIRDLQREEKLAQKNVRRRERRGGEGWENWTNGRVFAGHAGGDGVVRFDQPPFFQPFTTRPATRPSAATWAAPRPSPARSCARGGWRGSCT